MTLALLGLTITGGVMCLVVALYLDILRLDLKDLIDGDH